MNPLPIIFAAWRWFSGTTLGRYTLAIGAALFGLWLVFQRGKAAARKDQRIDDLEFGADIRRRTDAAERKHDADMAQLPDDDDARRAALSERLRKLRSGGN